MRVLFINSKDQNCGVADYGKRLYAIIKDHFDIDYAEGVAGIAPNSIYDIALFNYHYATMPFCVLDGQTRPKRIALFHEAHLNHDFDKVINVSDLPRPLTTYNRIDFKPFDGYPVIGSFGFGFPDKNYEGIAKMVVEQFKSAVLRLHIPFAKYGDEDGLLARNEISKCKKILEGSNIKLEYYHDFITENELIDWCSGNSINIFNCIPSNGRGISSSIDYALSARRPIAVSNSEMYRHMPREICLDNATLPELIAKGIEPLKQVYKDNSNAKLIEAISEWLKK